MCHDPRSPQPHPDTVSASGVTQADAPPATIAEDWPDLAAPEDVTVASEPLVAAAAQAAAEVVGGAVRAAEILRRAGVPIDSPGRCGGYSGVETVLFPAVAALFDDATTTQGLGWLIAVDRVLLVASSAAAVEVDRRIDWDGKGDAHEEAAPSVDRLLDTEIPDGPGLLLQLAESAPLDVLLQPIARGRTDDEVRADFLRRVENAPPETRAALWAIAARAREWCDTARHGAGILEDVLREVDARHGTPSGVA